MAVSRYINFISNHLKSKHKHIIPNKGELEEAIINLDVMPSMRALMTAGVALDRCHVAGYNCSYIPVDSPRSFDECMYILMCGTAVGFSVERERGEVTKGYLLDSCERDRWRAAERNLRNLVPLLLKNSSAPAMTIKPKAKPQKVRSPKRPSDDQTAAVGNAQAAHMSTQEVNNITSALGELERELTRPADRTLRTEVIISPPKAVDDNKTDTTGTPTASLGSCSLVSDDFEDAQPRNLDFADFASDSATIPETVPSFKTMEWMF